MLVPDFDTYLTMKVFDRLRPNGVLTPEDRRDFAGYLRERRAMVQAGVRRCPTWFQEELNALDSHLRAWWDAWTEQWVIDYLQDAGIVERLRRSGEDALDKDMAASMIQSAEDLLDLGSFYLTILRFRPTPEMQLDRRLLDMLRASDMQRYSPEAYMAMKEAEAEKIQQANDARGTEKMLAAVDSLSTERLEQFIAVKEAVETGERIVAHGDDLKMIERAYAEKQKALAREVAADSEDDVTRELREKAEYFSKPDVKEFVRGTPKRRIP